MRNIPFFIVALLAPAFAYAQEPPAELKQALEICLQHTKPGKLPMLADFDVGWEPCNAVREKMAKWASSQERQKPTATQEEKDLVAKAASQ